MERLLRSGIDVAVLDTPKTANTALHWAASFGNTFTVQILLEQFGADPNLTNAKGMTALHDAVIRGDLSIVRVLIKFGADPTICSRCSDEKSPLDLASDKEEMQGVLRSSSYLHQHHVNNVVNEENGGSSGSGLPELQPQPPASSCPEVYQSQTTL